MDENNGFYSASGDDIIQDDYITPPEHNYNYSSAPNPYEPKPKKQKRTNNFAVIVVCCLLSAVIAVGGTFLGLKYFGNGGNIEIYESPNGTNNVNISIDKQASSIVEAVAEKVTPSVVGIRTTTTTSGFFGNQSSSNGEGSGVIYRKDGYIITNYHVIENAIGDSRSKIQVFLGEDANDKTYDATVVGYNISADIAVIKINVTGLPVIDIADSSQLKVGQYVITVGNPGGLEFMDSVTYGVISGLNRVVSADSTVSLIQTDAAINPGNSGGALVNANGELVGINSSKIVSEEFEGMGFAIPSNTAVEIAKKIIEKENSPEPYIGITLSEKYTEEVLEYYGYPSGAVVLSVADNSPAYQAGIRKGDIITEFGGNKIKKYSDLEELLSECKPNQKITVKLYRNRRTYSTTITVGSNNLVA